MECRDNRSASYKITCHGWPGFSNFLSLFPSLSPGFFLLLFSLLLLVYRIVEILQVLVPGEGGGCGVEGGGFDTWEEIAVSAQVYQGVVQYNNADASG